MKWDGYTRIPELYFDEEDMKKIYNILDYNSIDVSAKNINMLLSILLDISYIWFGYENYNKAYENLELSIRDPDFMNAAILYYKITFNMHFVYSCQNKISTLERGQQLSEDDLEDSDKYPFKLFYIIVMGAKSLDIKPNYTNSLQQNNK